MPLPIAHSASALCLYGLMPRLRRRQSARQAGMLLGLGVVASVSPDFDFIPGLLIGEAGRFHHGPSHSLIVAAAWGVAFSGLYRLQHRGPVSWASLVYLFLCAFSHPLLDILSEDDTPPIGIPLFWPWSQVLIFSPDAPFAGISRSGDPGGFLASVLSVENLGAAWRELLFTTATAGSVWAVVLRRRPGISVPLGILALASLLGFLLLSIGRPS